MYLMSNYNPIHFKVLPDNCSAEERGPLKGESIKRGMTQNIAYENGEIGISDGRTRNF